MNPYTSHYKTIPTAELLNIMRHPDRFQQQAVEAAKQELAARNVALEEGKPTVPSATPLSEKLFDAANDSMDTFALSETTDRSSVEKTINSVALFFVFVSLYNAYNGIGFIMLLFSSVVPWGFGIRYLIFLPIVLVAVPIGTWLFWKGKKTGWIILAGFVSYSFLSFLIGGLSTLRVLHSASAEGIILTLTGLAIEIALLVCLWALCRKRIKDFYGISQQTVYITTIAFGLTGLVREVVQVLF